MLRHRRQTSAWDHAVAWRALQSRGKPPRNRALIGSAGVAQG